jgi:hypothetical protein
MTDHERTIGRLEAHVDDLRAEVKAMRGDIGELKALVEQARGARWLGQVIAGVIGAVASGIAWAAGLIRVN